MQKVNARCGGFQLNCVRSESIKEAVVAGLYLTRSKNRSDAVVSHMLRSVGIKTIKKLLIRLLEYVFQVVRHF